MVKKKMIEKKQTCVTSHSASKNVLRYDKGIVGNEVEETPEGYIKGRCIVTRCGVFFYKNADGTSRAELRHPDDVHEEESLDTIKMVPIVDGHPPEKLINADNAKKLSVGYTGQEVEENYPHIIANLVVTDKSTVEKIRNKKRNQLSLGYTVDLIPEPGVYNGEPYDFRQTNIRYNHLALVDEARAGPEARIALDGDDAESVEINVIGVQDMASKKQRKIKIDDTHEYMVDDEVGGHMEKMMHEKMELEKQKEELERKIEEMHNSIDKTTAERDSLRDKDHHNPMKEHEPLSGPEEDHHLPGEEMPKAEDDEIGPNGKEEIDPYDSYGMQSHVRDYEKPSHMKEHVVQEPKNKHYPQNLPQVTKVDAAEFNRRVNNRVKLLDMSKRYLDAQTLARIDGLSDLEIKKNIIKSIQKNASLDDKSEVYVNARFDSILEDLPKAKVLAAPARTDGLKDEWMQANSASARATMIKRQTEGYKNTNMRGK